jgi:hypothetical protein
MQRLHQVTEMRLQGTHYSSGGCFVVCEHCLPHAHAAREGPWQVEQLVQRLHQVTEVRPSPYMAAPLSAAQCLLCSGEVASKHGQHWLPCSLLVRGGAGGTRCCCSACNRFWR